MKDDLSHIDRLGQQAEMTSVIDVITHLAEAFPQCFFLRADNRRPLKLGIRADLAPRVPFTEEELTAALGHYARGEWYLRECVEGAPRIDLEGKVVGPVTAQEATFAHKILARRERWKIKQQAARRQSATARPAQRKAPGTPPMESVSPIHGSGKRRRRWKQASRPPLRSPQPMSSNGLRKGMGFPH